MKLGLILPKAIRAGVDFAAVGEISLDTFALGAGASGVLSKHSVHDIVDLAGGQAATAAVACARLGWRARWIGAVGDDSPGAYALSALKHDGVEICAVTRNNVTSRRAVILVDGSTGERTVFQHRSDRLDIQPGEFPTETYTTTRILLVDASDPGHALDAARLARAAGVATMVDVDYVWPGLHELLREIDVLVVPGSIAEHVAGVSGLGAALAEVGRISGAAAVVATLGPDGAIGWAGGHEVRAAATEVHAVDTTGAGDAFRAGFAAGWLARAGADPDLAELLADANLVAGLACRGLGAQTSLPRALEVPAHLRGRV